MTTPKLAILRDFAEEGWPSMDLVAEMMHAGLAQEGLLAGELVCPDFKRRATRLPLVGSSTRARDADRAINRWISYPGFARRIAAGFECFHVADHSYAGVVHALPARRTGVFCHDLDAFSCLLNPATHPRPRWFRAQMRRVLEGMQAAAIVFHATQEVARQIRNHGLIDPARLVQAPLGVAPEFAPTDDGAPVHSAVMRAAEAPFVMHVGSCIARKRIDLLLEVLAEARRTRRDLRLVKIGGEWSERDLAQRRRLGVDDSIIHLHNLDRRELAWLYRRAGAVLVTSEAEGFGLPVIEALACGAPVIASDIPVLREVGGDAVEFRAIGDIPAWAEAVNDAPQRCTRQSRIAQAAKYSWQSHARIIADAYLRLIGEK